MLEEIPLAVLVVFFFYFGYAFSPQYLSSIANIHEGIADIPVGVKRIHLLRFNLFDKQINNLLIQ